MDKKNIFIIDDETEILDLLEEILIDDSHKIFKFSTVKEFESAFPYENPSLFIVDLAIGDDSGIEVCSKLRKLYTDVPIYIISGFPNLLKDERIKTLTLTEVLQKPFDLSTFAQKIRDKDIPLCPIQIELFKQKVV